MIHFVGAGSGAADLITVRGKAFLEEADVLIYAGSLVNPQLLDYAKEDCVIYNSAKMTLEEVLEVMLQTEKDGKMTVRQLFLRSGVCFKSGIYAAKCVPECNYYTYGRQNSCSRERKY